MQCSLVLIACALFVVVRAGCGVLDHQTCDELCKMDSFWYGHCSGWDGTDFSCRCFEYKAPLDGERCKPKQEQCASKCIEVGSEGGFCYPQRDHEGRTNRTGCECFKALPNLRRRRSVVQYKIVQ